MKKNLDVKKQLLYYQSKIKSEFKYVKIDLIFWGIILFLIWNRNLFNFSNSLKFIINISFIVSSLYILYFIIKYIFIIKYKKK